MRTYHALLLASLGAACSDATLAPVDDGFAAVTAVLTVDPRALPNYAAQVLPAYYTPPQLQREEQNPLGNTLTNAGATLGRVLFYDRQLSRTATVSCGSCHQQSLGFGDSLQFSRGFDGLGQTGAHSMRLANARFNESGKYFWDLRAPTLEAQTTQPIRDAVEMGFDDAHGGFAAVIDRLSALPYYPPLFRLAFGDTVVTEDRVQRALAQYVRSIISVNSRWDQAFAQVLPGPPGAPPPFNVPLPGFTAQERRGQELYFQPPAAGGAGCQGCHTAPSFSLAANSNGNGLDAGQTQVFRSPSLKNLGLSRRFMHDGRFVSLEQVVEFYNSGVQEGPSLDPRLRGPGALPQRLALSDADKAALVSFLRTLTDQSLPTDARFANPFRAP
ncbi:MAG: hypothetical protein KF709_04760 [Gemmatimonadaceae bacterium]|nr:hypothetical protein [Gemmatimonadaceae bacterium]